MSSASHYQQILLPPKLDTQLGTLARQLSTTLTPVNRGTLVRFCIARQLPDLFNTLSQPDRRAQLTQAVTQSAGTGTPVLRVAELPIEWVAPYQGGVLVQTAATLKGVSGPQLITYLVNTASKQIAQQLGQPPAIKKLRAMRRELRQTPGVLVPTLRG